MLAAARNIIYRFCPTLLNVVSYLAAGYKKALVKKQCEMCKLLLAKKFPDSELSQNFRYMSGDFSVGYFYFAVSLLRKISFAILPNLLPRLFTLKNNVTY
jgi:hypothetical protein